MKKKIYRLGIELTNKKWSSLLLKKMVESGASRLLIPSYQKTFSIRQEEYVQPEGGHSSLQSYFTRQIAPENRPVDPDSSVLISPVDGRVEYVGQIGEKDTFEVKGKSYTIHELLGEKGYADSFKNGTIIVLYLSPANYHRIHSPADVTVGRQWIFGRHSYPVNAAGLKYGKRPLSKNYRLVTEMTSPYGKLAMVKVGAMFVNSIELTNSTDKWKKGEEIGQFSFGSTVILVAEKGAISNVHAPGPIKMGEKLATFSGNVR